MQHINRSEVFLDYLLRFHFLGGEKVRFCKFLGVGSEDHVINGHEQGVVVFEVLVMHMVERRAVEEVVQWRINVPRWEQLKVRVAERINEIETGYVQQRNHKGSFSTCCRYENGEREQKVVEQVL